MADKIGELQLDIQVTENQAAKKINQISKAISTLTETLTNLKSVSGELDKLAKIKLPSSLKNVKNLKINYKLQTATMPQVPTPQTNDFNAVQTGENVKTQFTLAKGTLIAVQETTKAQNEFKSKVVDTSKAFKRTSLNIQQEFEQQKKVGDQQDKNNKKTKESATLWSKLTRSIVRIGFYRIVRTTINQLSKALTEGVKNYAQFDDATNKAMSNLNNSFGQLKNTLSVTAGTFLVQLEPIITRVSDLLISLFDNINLVMAKMSGEKTYKRAIKQNNDYAKSLNKVNGALLSFDTFKTLNTNKTTKPEDLFEEVKISEELTDTQIFIEKIFEIGLIIKDIFVDIVDIVKNIIKIIMKSRVLELLKSIVLQIKGAFQAIKGLTQLMVGDFDEAWKNIKEGFINMFKGIIDFLKSAISQIADIFNPSKWFNFSRLTGKSGTLTTKAFANGGKFNTADMFYANENGRTELIASSNSGGGAVMNLDQWASVSETSFFNALARYGVAQNQRQSGFDMNSFGKMIASNTGFIGEMNRRNSALNLK